MIVIHIGLAKSGSTSIQIFLTRNEGDLRRLSIDFPRVGRMTRTQHVNIAHELNGEKDKFAQNIGGVADLRKYIQRCPEDAVVLSSEALEWAPEEGIRYLREQFSGLGRDFRIVVYIRALEKLMPSSYAQKIRHGFNIHDFDKFFEARMRDRRTNYFESIRRWAAVFGWETLRVRILDAQYLLNGDLIDDFLDAAGVDPTQPRLGGLPRPGRVNEASGWKVLEAIRGFYVRPDLLGDTHPLSVFLPRAVRKFDRECIERAGRDAGERCGWMADKGTYLTRAQGQRCLDIYARAIDDLNRHLPSRLPEPDGLDAGGFIERAFLPELARIDAGELSAFFDQVGVNLGHLVEPPAQRPESDVAAAAE